MIRKIVRISIRLLENILLFAALVTLTTVISFWLIKYSVPDLCVVSTSASKDAIEKGIYSCFDFWLNRYQTLIGSIFTGIIAFSTIRFIADQLQATKRQAAASAAASLRVRVPEIKEEIEKVDEVISLIEALFDPQKPLSSEPNNDNRLDAFDTIRALILLRMDLTTLKQKTENLGDLLPSHDRGNQYAIASAGFNKALKDLHFWTAGSAGEIIARKDEAAVKGMDVQRNFGIKLAEVKQQILAWRKRLRGARRSARAEAKKTRIAIREFEETAIKA